MGNFFHEKSFSRLLELVFLSSNFGENLPIENTKALVETGRISAICRFHFR